MASRAITTKYNELFKERVTEHYRTLFEQTLRRFRDNLRVTIETHGFKGETIRHIVLSPTRSAQDFQLIRSLARVKNARSRWLTS